MFWQTQEVVVFCGLAAIPIFVALARRNWGAAFGNVFIGLMAVCVALFSFFIYLAIALWILAFVNALRKKRQMYYVPRSPDGWN
jgi:hypothetical protein